MLVLDIKSNRCGRDMWLAVVGEQTEEDLGKSMGKCVVSGITVCTCLHWTYVAYIESSSMQ